MVNLAQTCNEFYVMRKGIRYLFPILAFTLLFSARNSYAQVVINEICASNISVQADNYSEYEDWFELYNTGAAPVDISGYWLSDSQNNNMKWLIPAGTIIQPNDHQVFFASGRDELAGLGLPYQLQDHANQTRMGSVFSDPAGIILDDFELQDPTQMNHSWGRTTDGAPTWNIFTTPTINAANAGATNYYTEKPTISV